MQIYSLYTREDSLCQSNGYFSLNLRKSCVSTIIQLLEIKEHDYIGWVGFGDGRELFSVASMYPHNIFVGFEINSTAFSIAKRVLNKLQLKNVQLYEKDILSFNSEKFTHVYSTAIGGPLLYQYLHELCTHRLCMLKEMWGDIPRDANVKRVFLSGSGGRKQLCAATPYLT